MGGLGKKYREGIADFEGGPHAELWQSSSREEDENRFGVKDSK